MHDARQAAQSAIEVMLLEMPFKVWISRATPVKSGFEMMRNSFVTQGSVCTHFGATADDGISKAELAYEFDHEYSLEILAHEAGHLLTWSSDPQFLDMLVANSKPGSKVFAYLQRKAEEAAWDVAEGLLRRIMGRRFDRQRFIKYRDKCVNTYPRGDPWTPSSAKSSSKLESSSLGAPSTTRASST